MKDIEITINNIKRKEIFILLHEIDTLFFPSLSTRIDLGKYADKISEYADTIGIRKNGKVIGMFSFYSNDTVNKKAFITLLGVIPEFAGMGYGTILLEECIKFVKEKNFQTIELKVNTKNKKAISLYEKFGFIPVDKDGLFLLMRKTV